MPSCWRASRDGCASRPGRRLARDGAAIEVLRAAGEDPNRYNPIIVHALSTPGIKPHRTATSKPRAYSLGGSGRADPRHTIGTPRPLNGPIMRTQWCRRTLETRSCVLTGPLQERSAFSLRAPKAGLDSLQGLIGARSGRSGMIPHLLRRQCRPREAAQPWHRDSAPEN